MKKILTLNKANQQGFTLLEIMVAIAIISIAFISVLKLYTESVSMDIASNFYTKAPLLAQKIISDWEMAMKSNSSIPAPVSDYLKKFPKFTFEINSVKLASDSVYPANAKEGDNFLFEIACTILYNNGEYSYTVKSLKFLDKH